MAHWDTSALLKLFLSEDDSIIFSRIAAEGSASVTAFIARHELHTAFVRRESEGALPEGESDRFYSDYLGDITSGDICEIPFSVSLEAEFARVLRQCLFHSTPLFVRTNDALHLASARIAGELEFVTADIRQRECATHLGFKVLP
jgi:predicted nucleic acid-binding protein